MRLPARILATLLVAWVLTGTATLSAQNRRADWAERCESSGRRNRPKYCETRELGMGSLRGALTVDGGRNGGVTVKGWDRDSVHVIAHVQATADSREEAREVAQTIRVLRSGAEIHSEGPGMGRDVSWSVSFEIFVPTHSDLSLTTANGGVDVEDVRGSMDLQSENGPVTLTAVGGDVRARVTNGPLAVRLAGKNWEGAGLDAETVNGPVDLDIPRDYSARLETGTVNGPFDTDSPLTVILQGRRHSRITSVLGAGGAPVRAVTTNGPVQIRRS